MSAQIDYYHFRVIKYLDRFVPQVSTTKFNGVYLEPHWQTIGKAEGYDTLEDAKCYCDFYRKLEDYGQTIEEFYW